jgi:isopenicillin N synthase-like dioxygenase
MPQFAPTVRNYYAHCERLALRLLAALSLNLGLTAPALARHFGAAHTSFPRLNYYPKCPRPARPEGLATTTDGYFGVNHHTDAGVLTVLLQERTAGARGIPPRPLESRRAAVRCSGHKHR